MTVTRTRRLINPEPRRKRTLTAKQLKYFGSKGQKAAAKRRRAAPKRKAVRHAKKNPASIITLGLVNPQRKAKKRVMAKRTKKRTSTARKANPTRRRRTTTTWRRANTTHRRTRRKNSTRVYVMKRNGARRRGARRRNPVFGVSGLGAGKAILAGLAGVYAGKTITPMIANAIPQVGGSPIFSAIISAVVAYGGGTLLRKWDSAIADGFMFGGFMQAGSQLLNLVVPANPLSLAGLGDWVPARFPVPHNPVLAGQRGLPSPAMAGGANLAGMGAAAGFR